MSADQSSSEARRSSAQTWAALLAHWTNFARAAVALPKDAEGERWRTSVPAIIGLQAVVMALGELDLLAAGAPGEYEVGVDRSAILIREHSAALNLAWRSEPLPPGVLELMEDARAALELARSAGSEVLAERAFDAPDPRAVLGRLRAEGFAGEFFAMARGDHAAPGFPVAFAKSPKGAPLGRTQVRVLAESYPDATIRRAPIMRQVYDRRNAAGEQTRVMADLNDTLPAGRPMLMVIPG